jgi:hypothetical protein
MTNILEAIVNIANNPVVAITNCKSSAKSVLI